MTAQAIHRQQIKEHFDELKDAMEVVSFYLSFCRAGRSYLPLIIPGRKRAICRFAG